MDLLRPAYTGTMAEGVGGPHALPRAAAPAAEAAPAAVAAAREPAATDAPASDAAPEDER
jgi:hypothetical protein